MAKINFTTIDTIFARLHRDLKGINLNETDVIEWIGEALSFLKAPKARDQAVAFLEVKNWKAPLPAHLQSVLQIAKNQLWTGPACENAVCPTEIVEEATDNCDLAFTDCNGNLITDFNVAYYRPFFDLIWEYSPWMSSGVYANFTPVRLSNHDFFQTLVCKEQDRSVYDATCNDEYTIVGTTDREFMFSFETGQVAVAFVKSAIDPKTGYPLVPDHISYVTAITYYIKWKIAEWYEWNGRAGSSNLAEKSEQKWLRYCMQAKNAMKKPTTIDEFENMLNNTHHLLPRRNQYQNFFGNLTQQESKGYMNTSNRRRNF